MLGNTWKIASWPHTQHYFFSVSAKRVHLRAPVQSVVITNTVAPAELTPKQVMIKPVVTAFLLVSAVKTADSQVVNVKLTSNTTVIETVIPAASIQGTNSTIINATSATQQQTAVVLASSLANAKLVPKTVHLANFCLRAPRPPLSSAKCSPHLSSK
ncbi:zinc finger protein 532-like [Vicugna pacos]|uniref:Zinc finger protein 532-like n=1 Tax=Vicugna pacos TaxID=30538 RepID=A0ABM5E1H1_VICPA